MTKINYSCQLLIQLNNLHLMIPNNLLTAATDLFMDLPLHLLHLLLELLFWVVDEPLVD